MATRVAMSTAALILIAGVVKAAEPHPNLRGAEDRLPPPTRSVKVLQASHLGTDGVDFLSCATVLPDGRLVLAGTHLGGGDRQRWGVAWSVLGEDGEAPAYEEVQGKRGETVIGERHPNRTGFLVVLAAGRDRVEQAIRLPWRSGSITAIASSADGAIYLGGTAGERVSALGRADDITPAELREAHGEEVQAERGYCLRLGPERGRIDWVRTFLGSPLQPPKRDGSADLGFRPVSLAWDPAAKVLRVSSGSLWTVDADGRVRSSQAIRGKGHRLAVRSDGLAAWGGFANTTLGGNGASRGPYRKPYLYLREPDGSMRFRFYDWSQRMLNHTCWLVADSTCMFLHFDREGMLYQAGWTHGGNTPYARFPQDFRADQPLSADIFPAMSGSPTPIYLHRIDPETGAVLAAQRILGVAPNTGMANGAWCDWLDSAHDGSLIVAGKSFPHMLQTPDALCPDMEPAGPCVWIFDRDLTELRFASAVPAVYQAGLIGGNEWTSSCVQADGRNLAILFSAAAGKDGEHGRPAPERTPVQHGFGGGAADGWFMIVDLGPADTPYPAPAKPMVRPKPWDGDGPLPQGLKHGERIGEGTSFDITPEFPKYPTCLVELRDPSGVRWPLVLMGQPADGGKLVPDPQAPVIKLTVTASALASPIGDRHPLVLRDRLKPGEDPEHLAFPEVRIEVDGVDGEIGISPGRRSSKLRLHARGTISCGERQAPITLAVSGTIRDGVQTGFVGGSGGVPLTFPGLGCTLLLIGEVPENVFPGGREGRTVHLTVSAFAAETGLRGRIDRGEVEPTNETARRIWRKKQDKRTGEPK